MKAKKSLGQNFLRVKKYLNMIADAGGVSKNDIVLEIGPGQGDLTEVLLQKEARVFAVEKDRELVPFLKEKFQTETLSGAFTVVEGDALEMSPEDFGLEDRKYKLIANIPYYITGALIEKYLTHNVSPKCVVFVIQKEVAERIVERDGKSSILSLSVKLFGKPKLVSVIPSGAFSPSPKVDSAILYIDIGKKVDKEFEARFFSVVHSAFKYKRKMLLSNLSSDFSREKIEKIFEKLSIDKKVRGEELDIDTFIAITKNLA